MELKFVFSVPPESLEVPGEVNRWSRDGVLFYYFIKQKNGAIASSGISIEAIGSRKRSLGLGSRRAIDNWGKISDDRPQHKG